jgi:hypothetical protein
MKQFVAAELVLDFVEGRIERNWFVTRAKERGA